MTTDSPDASAGPPPCPVCRAPAVDHGGIIQCSADPAHIDVYDLGAITGPVTLKYAPRDPGPQSRPDGLTTGERAAIGWARARHARWGPKGRGAADSMRQQFPWLDDTELARIALCMGSIIEQAHRVSWPDLDVGAWAHVLKAAAVDLASLWLGEPQDDAG